MAKKDDGAASAAGSGELRSNAEVRSGLILRPTFGIKSIRYAVVDGLAMFEGDIVLGTAQAVEKATAELRKTESGLLAAAVGITGAQFRWPNCRVPFDIDPTLPNQNRVTDAIAHWEAHTQYRFVLRTAANAGQFPDFVTFRPSSGCSSSVGRQGGQQFVNLGPGCSTGNAIHEIGHTIGLWHEQSREDRNSFVTIHFEKILPGFEHNFDQHITDGDDIGAYDYGSIMHYPRDAFSVDGSDTITPTTAGAQIGQRVALSAGDIAAANSFCPKLKDIKEPIKDHKEPIKDIKEHKEPIKDHKEAPLDTLKEAAHDTLKEATHDTLKEATHDTLKEATHDTLKEAAHDTLKEAAHDTLKEAAFDTVKEAVLDTTKEAAHDTLKEAAHDTLKEGAADPIGPIHPGFPLGDPRTGGGAGAVPFVVATPYRAPTARAMAMPKPNAADLDARLQNLAAAIAQAESTRDALQRQYDDTAAILRQTLGGADAGCGC